MDRIVIGIIHYVLSDARVRLVRQRIRHDELDIFIDGVEVGVFGSRYVCFIQARFFRVGTGSIIGFHIHFIGIVKTAQRDSFSVRVLQNGYFCSAVVNDSLQLGIYVYRFILPNGVERNDVGFIGVVRIGRIRRKCFGCVVCKRPTQEIIVRLYQRTGVSGKRNGCAGFILSGIGRYRSARSTVVVIRDGKFRYYDDIVRVCLRIASGDFIGFYGIFRVVCAKVLQIILGSNIGRKDSRSGVFVSKKANADIGTLFKGLFGRKGNLNGSGIVFYTEVIGVTVRRVVHNDYRTADGHIICGTIAILYTGTKTICSIITGRTGIGVVLYASAE